MFTVTIVKDLEHGKSFDFTTETEARDFFAKRVPNFSYGVLFLVDNIRHTLISARTY